VAAAAGAAAPETPPRTTGARTVQAAALFKLGIQDISGLRFAENHHGHVMAADRGHFIGSD
jgi:hypothetical protein